MKAQRLTLRARLVATLLVLATAGLVVSGVVINTQLEKYLMARVDQQLLNAAGSVGARLFGDHGNRGPGPPAPFDAFPVGTYGAVYTTTGTRTGETQLSFTSGADAQLDPNTTTIYSRPDISTAQISQAASTGGLLTTVSGSGSISSYRVLLQSVGDRVLAVAIPLTEIDATLTQLWWLEIGVGACVLLLLGVLTYLLIRAELAPLRRMSQTATQIAGGDLSSRVDAASGGTEVGQLGNALNTMLERIEEAFAARAASEERLRRFVGDASHELRTPLTSIRGYAEMFHRGAGASPADLDVIMRRIEGESERMSVLVDDLLMLARLDQRRELRRDAVDLRPLLTDVGLDLQAAHPDHPITVTATAPVWVAGDEDALRQVVVNLARNACVHTPSGTPVAMSVEAQADQAVIVVSDSGPGVPPDLADEVFERFTRADTSRARDAGGTGLGLSIVAAIIEAHGGTVRQGPTPGGGATFWCTIPLAGASLVPAAADHDANI